MRLRCCSNGLARDSGYTGGGEGGGRSSTRCSDWSVASFHGVIRLSLCLCPPSSSASAARLTDGPQWRQIVGEGAANLGRLGRLGPLAQDRLLPQHRDPLQDRWRAVHARRQQHPSAQERWAPSVAPPPPSGFSQDCRANHEPTTSLLHLLISHG